MKRTNWLQTGHPLAQWLGPGLWWYKQYITNEMRQPLNRGGSDLKPLLANQKLVVRYLHTNIINKSTEPMHRYREWDHPTP